eukprot:54908-Pleurochrysis_carterae.AAC.1
MRNAKTYVFEIRTFRDALHLLVKGLEWKAPVASSWSTVQNVHRYVAGKMVFWFQQPFVLRYLKRCHVGTVVASMMQSPLTATLRHLQQRSASGFHK